MEFNNILISRTDNIGDVVLTLPMLGLLKKNFPEKKIYFLGKKYTKPLIDACSYVDGFIEFEDLFEKNIQKNFFNSLNIDTVIHVFPNSKVAKTAKKIGIKNRIGTNRRLFHWFSCNYMVNLSRKNSKLHESQLNIKLLEPFGVKTDLSTHQILDLYGLEKTQKLTPELQKLFDKNKFNLIIHPKSKGSAKEWPKGHFVKLINHLNPQEFKIFLTGNKEENIFITENITPFIKHTNVVDLSGALNLSELISVINAADGLIAASTGPLHISAALGKHTLGLYPPVHSMSPNRWGALGKKTLCITSDNVFSNSCHKKCTHEPCRCMEFINVQKVSKIIENWIK